MKYDIVTIGDASEDIFVRPRDLKMVSDPRFVSGKGASFELGEKILLDDVQYEVGGSACNNAVAFSRQGYRAAAMVAVGEDTPGEKIENKFTKEGVDTSLVRQRVEYKTNFSVVFNIGGERTIFVYHGLDDYSCLKPDKNMQTEWVFLAPLGEGDEEVINGVISLAAEKNVKIAWNPGGIQIKKSAQHYRKLLACTTVLFVNREEGIKFANFPVAPQPKEIIKTLQSYGVKVVVMTDGKKGATSYDGDHYYHANILPCEKKDATGAGDSFATGFTGRLMKEETISPGVITEALAWGVVNSTSVVSYIGAQDGLLSQNQIEEQIAENSINIEMD